MFIMKATLIVSDDDWNKDVCVFIARIKDVCVFIARIKDVCVFIAH